MSEPVVRKPLANFLIKPTFQIKIILKILFVMAMTGVLTTLLIAWTYHARSQEGGFYYMDVRQDIELTSILGFILPALVAAQAVSFLVAVAIGLFSSRKAAVPTYKIEKWAAQLRAGNLNTRLAFREHDEMYELTRECNAAVDQYKRTLGEVRTAVECIEKAPDDPRQVRLGAEGIRKAIARYRFE